MVIALGDFMSAMCHACIGGTNVREDMRKLEMGVHVVVGTPGRVYDMINRRALSKYYSSSFGVRNCLLFGCLEVLLPIKLPTHHGAYF